MWHSIGPDQAATGRIPSRTPLRVLHILGSRNRLASTLKTGFSDLKAVPEIDFDIIEQSWA